MFLDLDAVLRNGSTIQRLNYAMDPQAHAGASCHGIVLDEPPVPAIFRESEKRVFDTGGWGLVVLTAVDRPLGWLKKTVTDGVRQGLWSVRVNENETHESRIQ